MVDRIDADVCVVGAGYAGLTAARRLTQAGKSVVVVEARDRVGGRIWTVKLDDGTSIDRGGAWIGPAHDRLFALADEMNVATYKTHIAGAHLLVDGDRNRKYTGLIPKISPLAIGSIVVTQAKIDRLAKKLPMDAPWDAPKANEWDNRTVADFMEHNGIKTQIARDLFDSVVRGLFTAPDLKDVSFLDLLMLVRGHGSINTLFSIKGGAQENLFDGGAGLTAQRIAAELGDAVRLSAPVRSISQRDDRVVVASDAVEVSAYHAVVTTPPSLAADIVFDPVLPADRLALYKAAIGGPESKTIIVYDEPFWRADGFSGQTADPQSPAEVTLDASPASGAPGVLGSFTFGRVAEQFDALDPAEQRRLVLERLTARFGKRAADPVAYIHTPWWDEEWTRGCSMAHFPPGVLTKYGRLLTQPFGRVHWAGTETSVRSHGAMDGAVRSGERAATEILNA